MTTISPDLPLNDPGFYASEPYETFRRLRDDVPVYWCETAGFWALTRYEDVVAVSRDPATFCNGHGMTMRGGELDDVTGGETLITMDAPEHTYQRKLVNRSFRQTAMSKLESHVREIAADVVDDVPAGEPIDFVDTVASRLPAIVIAELLGVPVEDRDKFVAWSNASVGVADPEYASMRDTALAEQYAYFEHIIDQRRAEPRDDLLTVLAGAERNEDAFSHDDLLALCFLLLAAGNETTRNLVSNSIVALVHHPEQLAALRETRDLTPAVEELLRWVSPAIHMARTVTVDTELRGQPLQSGDQVVMLYGAANRDDRVFGPTAEELHLDRDPNPHLSFGLGVHFCLGAALARLEARAILDELLERFSDWRIVGTVDRLRSTMILGIKHLPMVLRT